MVAVKNEERGRKRKQPVSASPPLNYVPPCIFQAQEHRRKTKRTHHLRCTWSSIGRPPFSLPPSLQRAIRCISASPPPSAIPPPPEREKSFLLLFSFLKSLFPPVSFPPDFRICKKGRKGGRKALSAETGDTISPFPFREKERKKRGP